MGFLGSLDKQKCIDLIVGSIGIYITYVVSGVLIEWMTKLPYKNMVTGEQTIFKSAVGLLFIERGIVWLLAEVYNYFTIPKSEAVTMPTKNVAICGFIIFIASVTNMEAVYMVSFPLVTMVKSCNILSVILVGVLCSRVTDKKLKLPPKKIVVAIFVTTGIILFRFFDPQVNLASVEGQKTQILGVVLLIVSLLADGFLPDFQAQIKQNYKPSPTQMMLQVNKWSFIFCLLWGIIIGQFVYSIQFCYYYPLFCIHVVGMSVLAFIGQIFIYRMIKQFKQHIVPFVVTTRKFVTVGLNLVYFNHLIGLGQIVGIILVFIITTYEFITELMKDSSNHEAAPVVDRGQKLADSQLSQQKNEFPVDGQLQKAQGYNQNESLTQQNK